MKLSNYILVCLITVSSVAFSQPSFTNIDTLLAKNIRAVNLNDSVYYLSLLNQPAIFKGKTAKTTFDSLVVLKPFTDAFSDLIESLKEMTLSPDFTVAYSDYECIDGKKLRPDAKGKTPLHVNLIINDTMLLKMLFWVNINKGLYSIETPMVPMFLESKE
ncbi:MAG: hypothetical protein HY062_04960 [Bacteroidetes bacterium]|nr:hypothetical protein [Bacteroidota bacterium]